MDFLAAGVRGRERAIYKGLVILLRVLGKIDGVLGL